MVDSDLPQSGFWIIYHPREVYVLDNAAVKLGNNPKKIDPFYEQFYRVLKRHMDGKTREVRNCSWEYLRTEMETEVVARSHKGAGKPSTKKLRYAVEQLKKLGLVEQKEEDRSLVFFLRLAPKKREFSEHSKNPSRGRGAVEGQSKRGTKLSPELQQLTYDFDSTGACQQGHHRGSLSSISSFNYSIPIDSYIQDSNLMPLDTYLPPIQNKKPSLSFGSFSQKDAKSRKSRDFFKIGEELKYECDDFLMVWEKFPPRAGKKRKKAEAYKKWVLKKLAVFKTKILEDIDWSMTYDRQWREGYPPDLVTYFNQRQWECEKSIEMQTGEWTYEGYLARKAQKGKSIEAERGEWTYEGYLARKAKKGS